MKHESRGASIQMWVVVIMLVLTYAGLLWYGISHALFNNSNDDPACRANTARIAVHFDNVGLLRGYEGDVVAREALLRSAIEGRLLIADREALSCQDDLAVCDKVFASYAGQPIGLRPEQIVRCATLLGRVVEVTDLSGDDVFNQQ